MPQNDTPASAAPPWPLVAWLLAFVGVVAAAALGKFVEAGVTWLLKEHMSTLWSGVVMIVPAFIGAVGGAFWRERVWRAEYSRLDARWRQWGEGREADWNEWGREQQSISQPIVRGLVLGTDHRSAADEIVRTLHRAWFSDEKGNMDPRYRVSLWVPSPNVGSDAESWMCLARTFAGATEKRWPYKAEPLGPGCGAIAATAYLGASYSLPGLLEEHRQGEKWHEYCKEAYMNSEEARQRSWPGCSMETHMARARSGHPFVILAVERKDGRPIEPKRSANGLSADLQLAAELLKLSEVQQ